MSQSSGKAAGAETAKDEAKHKFDRQQKLNKLKERERKASHKAARAKAQTLEKLRKARRHARILAAASHEEAVAAVRELAAELAAGVRAPAQAGS